MSVMKRFSIILAFLFAIAQWSFSQTNLQEVVYLKNGSRIKGVIIEQIPNVSLKIQTADGSLFVCEMDDVEKITKEATTRPIRQSSSRNRSESGYKTRGYKGFVDLGYTAGVGDYAIGRFELTTSHGFQFNPYLFLGGGTGFQIYHEADVVTMPIFVDFRANFTKGSIVPFAGVKAGYSAQLTDDGGVGFYCAPSVGVKFMVNRRMALNLTAGYTVQMIDIGYSDNYYNYSGSVNMGGVSFKVGLEF